MRQNTLLAIVLLVCSSAAIGDGDDRVLWRYSIGKSIPYPPALADGNIVIAADNTMLGFNPEGERVWKTVRDDVSFFWTPTVTEDGSIYVPALTTDDEGRRSQALLAFDGEGHLRWELSLMSEGSESVDTRWMTTAVSVAPNGLVIAGVQPDSSVWAVRPDGQVAWRAKLGVAARVPCIDERGTAYVVGSDGAIYAITVEGEAAWRLDLDGLKAQSIILGTRGLLYVVTNKPDAIVAVDRSGQEEWRYVVRSMNGQPVTDGDGKVVFTAYAGASDETASLMALTPDGLDYWLGPDIGSFYGPPLIGDDETAYVMAMIERKSVLLAIDTVNGMEKWSVPVPEVFGVMTMSDDGTLYSVAGMGELMALRTDSRGLADSPWPKDRADQRNTGAVATGITAVLDGVRQLPAGVPQLHQNSPNPFNTSTAIDFILSERSRVSLTVHDVLGRRVRELVAGRRDRGAHSVSWDGRDDAGRELATGAYIYQLRTEKRTRAKKLLLTGAALHGLHLPRALSPIETRVLARLVRRGLTPFRTGEGRKNVLVMVRRGGVSCTDVRGSLRGAGEEGGGLAARNRGDRWQRQLTVRLP